jgi:hypothetical protein
MDPAVLLEPIGHVVHPDGSLIPMLLLYVPALHRVHPHCVPPVAFHEPAAHGIQTPDEPQLPAIHEHDAMVVCRVALLVPLYAGHDVHEDAAINEE